MYTSVCSEVSPSKVGLYSQRLEDLRGFGRHGKEKIAVRSCCLGVEWDRVFAPRKQKKVL